MVMKTTDYLLAKTRGTAQEALSFLSRLAGVKRLDEVRRYVETVYLLAPQVGLDPSIIVAHAANETNYFRDDNWELRLNPAGMGVTGPTVDGESFENGEAAARAHVAHMLLYATGTIRSPLSSSDDPRYNAYIDTFGQRTVATQIEGLSGAWAKDEEAAEAIVSKGNEIFGDLPESTKEKDDPKGPTPSVLRNRYGEVWDGRVSLRVGQNVYRASRRTVTVNVDELNLRVYADTDDNISPIIRSVRYGERVRVIGWVIGERVGTENRWWITENHERMWVGGTSQKP